MREATHLDKTLVVDILSRSFNTNKSVNFVARQDKSRQKRIKLLMEYAFYAGMQSGQVFISDDGKACCILLFPEQKKTTPVTILWNIKLAFGCIGLSGILPVLKREALIRRFAPQQPYVHLWFMGVTPEHQNKGLGSKLLKEMIAFCDQQQKIIHLETSTERNLPFYKNQGFKISHTLEADELGYRLYLMRRD